MVCLFECRIIMLTAIVLAWISLNVITSPNSGSKSVMVWIFVSLSLIMLHVERCLLFAGDCVYRPQPQCSPATVLVALLLLMGGVKRNPGPTASTPPCDVSHRSAISRQTIHTGVLNKHTSILQHAQPATRRRLSTMSSMTTA